MAEKTVSSVCGMLCSVVEHLVKTEGLTAFGKGSISLFEDLNVGWHASESPPREFLATVKVTDVPSWTILEVGWDVAGPMGNTMSVDMFVKDLSKMFQEQSSEYRSLRVV